MRLGKKADIFLFSGTVLAAMLFVAYLTITAIAWVVEHFNLNELLAFVFVYGSVLILIYAIFMWIYGLLRLITGRRGR